MKAQIIVVSLLAAALARPLYAQDMMHGSVHEQQGHAMKSGHEGACLVMSGKNTIGFYLDNKKTLELSGEQVKKLELLQTYLEQPLAEFSAILQQSNQEIEALLEQPGVTRAVLREKVQAMEEYFTGMKVANLDARRQAGNILTPEQWNKAQALRNQAGNESGGEMGGCGMMMSEKKDGQKTEEHQMHH